MLPTNGQSNAKTAFEGLKQALIQAPVLAYPIFQEGFLLETDIFGVGSGTVLSQKQSDSTVRPVAYAIKTLQPQEKNYSISEQDGLGVVWLVKYFKHYLYGHSCTAYTDHKALKLLLHTPHPSGKLAGWGMALQELDVKIKYHPGSKNQKAGTLPQQVMELKNQLLPVIAAIATDGVESTLAGGTFTSYQ